MPLKIEMREVTPEPEKSPLNTRDPAVEDGISGWESSVMQYTRTLVRSAENLPPSDIQIRFYRTVVEKLQNSDEVFTEAQNLAFKRMCAEDLFSDHFPRFTLKYRAVLVNEYEKSGFTGLPDCNPESIEMYLQRQIPQEDIQPDFPPVTHFAPESGQASIRNPNSVAKESAEDKFPELTAGLELVYANRRPREGISKEEVTQILKDFLTHNHKVRSNAFFWSRASEAQNPEDQQMWLRALLQHHLQNSRIRNFSEIVSVWADAEYPEVEQLNMARIKTTREQRLLEWIIRWFEQ